MSLSPSADLPCARHYVDRDAAAQAVRLALPMLEAAMQDRRAGDSGFLYVVVMDPARPPGAAPFEQAILYEHAVGDRSKWDADYDAFARAKARLSWRTGRDSHLVQTLHPQLLVRGDTRLWGSVSLDDYVVGVSGAQPWFDEAFALAVAGCLRAIVKERALAAAGHTVE